MPEQIKIRAIYPTSYSHVKAFLQCPRQFYHVKHLNEFPFVETPAIREGNEFHKAAELYIGKNKPLPSKHAYAKKVLDMLNAKPGDKFPELKMGITDSLVPCGFFSPDVWIRGVIDLLILDKPKKLGWVIDYKTGKNTKYADVDQLELMALLTFASYPEIDHVKSGLVFVKANELIRKDFFRKDRTMLWSRWVNRHQRMMKAHKDNTWPTRESGLCKAHCPVVDCEHNGANR